SADYCSRLRESEQPPPRPLRPCQIDETNSRPQPCSHRVIFRTLLSVACPRIGRSGIRIDVRFLPIAGNFFAANDSLPVLAAHGVATIAKRLSESGLLREEKGRWRRVNYREAVWT